MGEEGEPSVQLCPLGTQPSFPGALYAVLFPDHEGDWPRPATKLKKNRKGRNASRLRDRRLKRRDGVLSKKNQYKGKAE